MQNFDDNESRRQINICSFFENTYTFLQDYFQKQSTINFIYFEQIYNHNKKTLFFFVFENYAIITKRNCFFLY